MLSSNTGFFERWSRATKDLNCLVEICFKSTGPARGCRPRCRGAARGRRRHRRAASVAGEALMGKPPSVSNLLRNRAQLLQVVCLRCIPPSTPTLPASLPPTPEGRALVGEVIKLSEQCDQQAVGGRSSVMPPPSRDALPPSPHRGAPCLPLSAHPATPLAVVAVVVVVASGCCCAATAPPGRHSAVGTTTAPARHTAMTVMGLDSRPRLGPVRTSGL